MTRDIDSDRRTGCEETGIESGHGDDDHRIDPTRRSVLASVAALGTAGAIGRAGASQQSEPATSVAEAQQAVVQIVAQGSFVDPQVGPVQDVAGAGSGFIIDPSGIAVTNNHVVTGAATLEVFVGGESYNARVLGIAECSDLAVIEIDGDGFPYLEWYQEAVAPLLDVWALGYPLGSPDQSITRGIVSNVAADGDTSWASVDSVIEHDARIRPGNSGGPLVAADGRVVGINYAGEDVFDFNFAIGVDVARPLVEEQLRQGENVHAIGINGQAVVSEDGTLSGIWVASVESGSPAYEADLQPGDLIVRMEGLSLADDGTMADYCDILRSRSPENVLVVNVLRLLTGELLAGEINGDPLAVILSEGDGGLGDQAGYPEYGVVTDDTGAISAEVPTEWAQIDGRPQNVGPSLVVSPDIQGFLETFDVPGVFILASTELGEDPDAILDEFAVGGCAGSERGDYDDGLYTGRFERFQGCGDIGSELVNVACYPEDQSFAIVVSVQLVDARDREALDKIIASFQVAGVEGQVVTMGPTTGGTTTGAPATGEETTSGPSTPGPTTTSET